MRTARIAMLAALVLVLCSCLTGVGAEAPMSNETSLLSALIQRTQPSTLSATPAEPIQIQHLSSSVDLLVSGTGDVNGYHISVANASNPTVWLPLATLDPPVGTDFSWMGQQCVTGDGAYVVATIAPSIAATEPDDRAEGGFTYSISVATGAVRPLLSNVTLASYSPACGVGDIVALTRYLTEDDAPTEVFLVDAATGAGTATFNNSDEVTSAVPLSSTTAVAVDGRQLLSLAGGKAKVEATLDQDGYDIVPVAGGGVDLLTASLADPTTAGVWHWQAGTGLEKIGKGTVASTTISLGREGEVAVMGGESNSSPAAAGVRWLARPGGGGVSGLSLDLDAELMTKESGTTAKYFVQGASGEQAVTIPVAGSSPSPTPVPSPSPVAVSPAPPGPTKSGSVAASTSMAIPPASTGVQTDGYVEDSTNQTDPLCAIPRLDSSDQVMQPSDSQIDWAIQEATQGALTQSETGDPTWGLQPFTPSADFPLPVTVPREVMSGVAMAESAWDQASYHASRGMPGDPLISNYYGESSDGTSWDYDDADCGYGLTQQTNGMEVGDDLFPANAQAAVALDLEENAAAGTWTMATTWEQLEQLGIIANNGDPTMIENWYLAIWAYNTGIHPDDGSGDAGLGWANNPMNPASPRGDPGEGVPAHEFLDNANYYNFDLSHPSDWPYQEQVIGYLAYGNEPFAASTKYPTLPPNSEFCTAADNCDPSDASNPCQLSNDHCWWQWPVTWVDCSTSCTAGYWYISPGTSEPAAPRDPYPPACALPSGSGPSPGQAIVVDTQPSDINMVGCADPPSNWSNDGTYTTSFGSMAVIDYHQLGAGFGGHMYFTHAEDPGAWAVTGTWTPNLATAGQYQVWVFVPSDGGTVSSITYQVTSGQGATWNTMPVDQDAYNNQWVEVGSFPMEQGASVSLSNTIGTNTNVDIAYSAVAFDLVSTSPGQPVIGAPIASAEVLGGTNCSCSNADLGQTSAGDPVDTAFGNFTEEYTDLSLAGGGLPLEFTRTYNSLAGGADGPLGYGWTSDALMSMSQPGGSGPVTITQEGGSQVVFDPSGSGYAPAEPRVEAGLAHNANGTWTFVRKATDTFTFSATGQLMSETDAAGDTVGYAYNSDGQLTTITGQGGRTLTITWTGNNITSVTDANVSPARSVSYAYDSAGDLTTVTDVNGNETQVGYDANHHIISIEDPRGYTSTLGYNSSGEVSWQKDQLGRETTFSYVGNPDSSVGSTTTVTDPSGDVTVDVYQYGLLASQTKGYGTPQAATTTYSYDPSTTALLSETDPDGETTYFSVDSNGNQLWETDPLGRRTTATYNSFNEPLTKTDALGVTTTYTYDNKGRLLSTSTPLIGAGQSSTTTYAYGDSSNPSEPTTMVDADGKTWTYTYDAYGDKTSSTDPLGNETTDTYNADGWRLTQVAPKGNVSGCHCAGQYTTTYSYRADGLQTAVTNPLGYTSTSQYDADGDLVMSTDADGNVTTYTFDAADEQVQVTAADGSTTATSYAPDGQVLQKTDELNNALLSYTYNSLGQVSSETDGDGRTTTYTYDGDGNLLTQQGPGGDCAGLPATGCTTDTYDADGELTSTTYSDGVTPNITAVTYDADGHRTSMTTTAVSSSRTYDSLGRLTSSTEGSSTVSYGYDLKGQLTSITYPGTLTVTRTYNAGGELTDVEDWNGNTTAFGYDPDGNLTTETLPAAGAGVVDTFTYNAADQMTQIQDSKGGTTLFSATYLLNKDGEVTGDSSQPTSVADDQYTQLNQLCYAGSSASSACASAPSGADVYSYDAAGDLVTDEGVTQTFDAAEQLCWSVEGTSGNGCSSPPTGATTYSYSTDGDLTTITPSTGSAINLGYDEADELSSWSSGVTSATYTYNGEGLRVSKTVNGTATPQAWDESESVPLMIQDGTTSFVYGPGGLPLEQISGSTTVFLHHDRMGSTRLITGSAGTALATFTYDPYGNLTAETGSTTTRLLYDGQYQDAESGLYYLQARYYDPSTGQFLTVDPDVAFTWSPYGYAAGNPVNRLDPSGVDPWDPNGRYAATPQLQPHPWNDVPPLCAGTSPTPVQSTPVLVPTLPFPDAGSGNPAAGGSLIGGGTLIAGIGGGLAFEGGTEFAAAGGSLALAAAGGLGVLTGVGILLIGTVLIIWGVSELVGHQ